MGLGWSVMGIRVSSYFEDDLINSFYGFDFFFLDSFSLSLSVRRERRRKWKEEG